MMRWYGKARLPSLNSCMYCQWRRMLLMCFMLQIERSPLSIRWWQTKLVVGIKACSNSLKGAEEENSENILEVGWLGGGGVPYHTGSAKWIMKSHVFDTKVGLSCIIPAQIHAPLLQPPFYNLNMFFKLSPVTWREITEKGFQKNLRSTDLKLKYSWKWNLASQGLECFNCRACPR